MIHHCGFFRSSQVREVSWYLALWESVKSPQLDCWTLSESELLMWLCSSVTDNSHLGDDASILRRKRRKLRILDIRIKYLPTPLVVNPGKLLQREKFLVEPALKSIYPRDRYSAVQCTDWSTPSLHQNKHVITLETLKRAAKSILRRKKSL